MDPVTSIAIASLRAKFEETFIDDPRYSSASAVQSYSGQSLRSKFDAAFNDGQRSNHVAPAPTALPTFTPMKKKFRSAPYEFERNWLGNPTPPNTRAGRKRFWKENMLTDNAWNHKATPEEKFQNALSQIDPLGEKTEKYLADAPYNNLLEFMSVFTSACGAKSFTPRGLAHLKGEDYNARHFGIFGNERTSEYLAEMNKASGTDWPSLEKKGMKVIPKLLTKPLKKEIMSPFNKSDMYGMANDLGHEYLTPPAYESPSLISGATSTAQDHLEAGGNPFKHGYTMIKHGVQGGQEFSKRMKNLGSISRRHARRPQEQVIRETFEEIYKMPAPELQLPPALPRKGTKSRGAKNARGKKVKSRR